jgi:hypothetical protein
MVPCSTSFVAYIPSKLVILRGSFVAYRPSNKLVILWGGGGGGNTLTMIVTVSILFAKTVSFSLHRHTAEKKMTKRRGGNIGFLFLATTNGSAPGALTKGRVCHMYVATVSDLFQKMAHRSRVSPIWLLKLQVEVPKVLY